MTDTSAAVVDAITNAGQGSEETSPSTPPVGNPPNEGVAQPGRSPYADYLDKFPEHMRGVAEPVFKEWDANTTRKFQELHSKYDPYSTVLDEYDPESLQTMAAVMSQLEADPQGFLAQLQGLFGSEEQGPGNNGTEEVPDGSDSSVDDFGLPSDHPLVQKYTELEKAVGMMAEYMNDQIGTQTQEQEDKELADTLASMKQDADKYPNFNEERVLSFAVANGGDLDAAYKSYMDLRQEVASEFSKSPNFTAPKILGGSGGLPSAGFDTSTLKGSAAVDYVKQLLDAHNSQT